MDGRIVRQTTMRETICLPQMEGDKIKSNHTCIGTEKLFLHIFPPEKNQITRTADVTLIRTAFKIFIDIYVTGLDFSVHEMNINKEG